MPAGCSKETRSCSTGWPGDPVPQPGEYFWLAEQVTGVGAATVSDAARIELADSALHAPQAGFGGHELYPELLDKGAVLVCRLAWNHPLPTATSEPPGFHGRINTG